MPDQKLVLGIRNNLPVGTTAEEFEEAYQTVYKPFMTLLYNHPGVYMGAYYSGFLLERLEERHPEFIMLLNDLSKRKQIELLGGVHYEAFLPLVPIPDRLGQIEYLTTFIRKRFGRRPRGGVLPGDVWEPSLASTLKSAGFDYTFLPDSYFVNAGCRGKELYMPAFTEDLGKNIIVYPSSTGLSERIGSVEPATFIDELSLIYRTTGTECICLFLPPEAPHDWYDRFFTLLEERSDEISSYRPVRATRGVTDPPKRYFSSVTFQSMMRWIEGTMGDDQNFPDASVLPAGSYRHFLTRYPEGNALYSKMLYTSLLVNQIRGDRSRKKTAREELWKAQCHTAYWHGQNGGIYRRAYRQAAYFSLLESEKITKERGIFKPSVFITDFDMDGNQEYLYRGINVNAYVHRRGGALIELDYFPACWNYLATMARHEELYLQEDACRDTRPRNSFVEHIYAERCSAEELLKNGLTDRVDFATALFREESLSRENREVVLRAESVAALAEGALPLSLGKGYLFRKNTVMLQYSLGTAVEGNHSFTFSTELNLAFSHPDQLKSAAVEGDEGGLVLSLEDEGIKSRITLSCDLPFEWVLAPMSIPYLTAEGIVEEYQQHLLLVSWPVTLTGESEWKATIQIKIDKL